MKFNYQARTKSGEIQTGTAEATSKETAINLLRSHGLYVTALEEEAAPFYAKRIRIFERISKKEIVALSRQLAIMFKSEVPLIEVLETLARQTKNQSLKEKLLDMVEKIEGGNPLSKTFGFYPEIFSTFYINMVKSGEASGKLSDIFIYLAEHIEREYNFNGKIISALIYPAFVLVVFLAVVGVVTFYVIPKLTPLLTESGGQLTLITQILLGTIAFLKKWGWIVILGLAFFVFFIYRYRKTKEGKFFFDKFLLKLPFISSFLKKIYLSRFATNLSTLVAGGLPITKALEITGEVVGNEIYKSIILNTSEGVKRGESLSSILQRYPEAITPLFIQLTVVGEKTGTLDTALVNVVDFYQKDVDRTLDSFINLLEPIMIVVLGLFVAGLMASLLIPLYQRFSF